jgi:NAD(P)-dependent dehydrogenase (short-subunit alcohol dehydrogenase family)
MFSLENKSAIVTGGGSGIGKAIAILFAKQGATVHILDLGDNGKQAADEIIGLSQKAFHHACDVSSQAEVQKIVASIAGDNAIHILVNNAGIAHIGNAENTSEEDLDRLYNINIKGVYNCIHEVIPFMKKSGGVILNMASIASLSGIPDRFAYSMTKGAVVGMTLSTAKDYIKHNIRCNCISPARVHTPFVDGFLAKNYPGKEKEMFEKLSKGQPIGRMAQPEEVAHLALYLCSDEASFITGCDYPFDGGFTKLNN